ncbi:MAG TPA: outer membrane beta-barrel protein [Polyangiales bacterium]|nr:outer membrane beta-barrel protein [Polyangiales bacterium]
MQPQQYPQQYPPPSAAPEYPPPVGYPPGYGGLAEAGGEPLVSSAAGALQFTLGTYIVRYRSESLSFDMNAGELSRSQVKWGFGDDAAVLLEGGYGLNENMIVGGLLQIGGTSTTEKIGEVETPISNFSLTLAPKFDYQFLPTSKFNPFVGGALGFSIGSSTLAARDESITAFVAYARAGVRCFLFDGFSVDPALVFGFGIGGGSQEAMTNKLDFSLTRFQIGLAVSTSGWLRI